MPKRMKVWASWLWMVLMLMTKISLVTGLNEVCSDAVALTCGQSVHGDTRLAAYHGPFNCSGMPHTAQQLWYTLQVTEKLSVTLSTCSATWDTRISVFGGTCDALKCESANDDACGSASHLRAVLQPGTYYVMIHGYAAKTGEFTLDVTCGTAWTRIFECDNFENSINRLDFTPEVIKQMANTATKIKICGFGNQTYCEESLPNTFPIQMLREGSTISQPHGQECHDGCVAQTWKGPFPELMRSNCASLYTPGQALVSGVLHQACGNPAGLQLSVVDYGLCTWATPKPTTRFEMYIDTQLVISPNCGDLGTTGALYITDGLEGALVVDLSVKITDAGRRGVPIFGNSYGDGWGIYFYPGGVYTPETGDRPWNISNDPDPTDGEWHHVILSDNALWVDGVYVLSLQNHLADASDFWVGWRSTQHHREPKGRLEVKDIQLYSVTVSSPSDGNPTFTSQLLSRLQPESGLLQDLVNPLALWNSEGMQDPTCQVRNDRTSNVAGCTTFQIHITTSANPQEMGWSIGGSKPALGVRPNTYPVPLSNVSVTACLVPGTYTFTAVDLYGDGWGNAKYSIAIGDNVLLAVDGVTAAKRSQSFTVLESTGVCFTNSPDCHPNAYCIDDDAGGKCQCLPGYIGDGVTSCRSPQKEEEEANPNPDCMDMPGWTDRNRHTCADYTSMGWCSHWWYGENWTRSWGTFADYAARGSVGADVACCNCGLARRPKLNVDCQLGEWEDWAVCTSVGEGSCMQTRRRPVLTRSYFGQECDSLTETRPCQGCPQCHLSEWNDWTCVSRRVQLRVRQVNTSSPSSAAPLCPDLGQVGPGRAFCRGFPSMHAGPVMQMSGSNQNGELGIPHSTQETVPTLVGSSISQMPIISVVLGGHHSAVIVGTAQLRQVFVTGQNNFGQLGLGDNVERKSFTLLPTPGSLADQIGSIALGYYHTMVITSTGFLYTCGAGGFGQLGLFSNANSYVLQQVRSVVSSGTRAIPINSVNVSSIAAGGYHSAFLTSDGAPYLFGRGSYGQLGHNNRQSLNIPKRVSFFAGRKVVIAVTLGLYHSAFITSTDELYMVGDNSKSQLGFTSTSSYIEPQLLDVFSGSGIRQMALGFSHSMVLLSNGSVYTFGGNLQDALKSTSDPKPKQVTFPSGVLIEKIAAGWYTNAAIDDTRGDLYTWGDNSYGQGGLGRVRQTPFPETVGTRDCAGPVISVALGAVHLAVLRVGTLTPTQTGTQTPSPTSSRTPTAPPTSSATGSNSAIPTGSTSWSSTALTTLSATYSLTSSTSPTYPPTLTPSFATCGLTNVTLTSGPWTLRSVVSCIQMVHLGPGSTVFTKRAIGVRLLTVPAPVALAVLEGCEEVNGSDTCRWHFTSLDAGHQFTVPFGPTQHGVLEVFYGAGAAVQYRAVDNPVQLELFIEYHSTLALLIPACVASMVCAACLVGICWWILRWQQGERLKIKDWDFNWRLRLLSVQIAIALGMWAILTGVAWCIIVVSTSHPTINPLELLIVGVGVTAIGGVVALSSFVWAMRDPQHFICIACDEPVSRWRFLGTYLPNPNHPRCHAKAHSDHILCVHCSKPVIDDCWPEAPPQHRYHMQCWDALCTLLVNDPQQIHHWVTKQRDSRELTEVELVHILAATVKHSAMDAIVNLVAISPTLPSVPIAQIGGHTAIHLAAQEGKLQVLELLLQSEPQCLDPACFPDHGRAPSLSITGLEEGNDVYISQPFLSFNDRAVYLGHSQGWYLYYYDPGADDSKVKYTEGWCLSPHLGSGTPHWRIPLPEGTGELTCRSIAPDGQERCQSLRRRQSRRASSNGWRMLDFLLQHEDEQGSEQLGEHSEDGDTEQHTTTERGTSYSQDSSPAPPPSPAKFDSATCVHHGAWMVEVEAEFPPNVQIVFLSHTTSLLEAAISSSHPDTVRYIIQLYQAQDPTCVTWNYYTSHGLWEPFPMYAQVEIWAALSQGQTLITLACNEFERQPLTLDLTRKVCWDSKGERSIYSVFHAIFQHRLSEVDPFEVTSEVATVLNRKDAVVVMAPAHVALSDLSPDIITILIKEGIFQFASWLLPAKMSGPAPQLNSFYEEMFSKMLHQVVIQMMEVPEHTFSCVSTCGTVTQGRLNATGLGNRMIDGLEQDQSNDQVAFYAPGYENDEGTLPFCAKLPENEMGLSFKLNPIVQMAMDALMKLHELQRQHFPQKARHIIAVYVYSYELSYDRGGYDQIYGAMNKAMRLRIKGLIDFWRPLIWEIDVALQAFPSYKGKCYRGINCEISPDQYQTGTTICWPQFSSASQDQSVAEDFAKGETGTLFFLTSVSAKPISAVSRYPEEAEVLFPPNSVFQVTSTLFGTSEIGAFYGRVDNVAMSETIGEVSQVHVPDVVPHVRVAGHTSFLLHVPTEMKMRMLDFLSEMGVMVMEPLNDAASMAGELLLTQELGDFPWISHED